MAAPAPSPALSASFDVTSGKVGVVFAASSTPEQVNACQSQVAAAPAPSGLSASDASAWRNRESLKCQGTLKELSKTDIMFNGPQVYSQLILAGQGALSKTPGYPNTVSTVQMDAWPIGTDSAVTSDGTNLPSVQYWDLKDNQGSLKELVYTNASGTSNVLYRNSTANLTHVVSLTPGGSKAVADPVAAPTVAAVEEEGSFGWFSAFSSSMCCLAILGAGFTFLKRK